MWKWHFYSVLVHGVDRTFRRVIATWPQWGFSGCCQITAWSWGVLSQGNMWLGKSLRLFILGAWVLSGERKVGEWQKGRWISPVVEQLPQECSAQGWNAQRFPLYSMCGLLIGPWDDRTHFIAHEMWLVITLPWVWCCWAERIFAICGKLCTALVFYKCKASSFRSICVHLFYYCLMTTLRIHAGEAGWWGENEESLWFYFPGLSLKGEQGWGNFGPLAF